MTSLVHHKVHVYLRNRIRCSTEHLSPRWGTRYSHPQGICQLGIPVQESTRPLLQANQPTTAWARQPSQLRAFPCGLPRLSRSQRGASPPAWSEGSLAGAAR